MGIRGLSGWIGWAAEKAVVHPNWKMWEGKKIGIDILGFLYKAKAQKISPFIYIIELIIACKRLNITPVAVFDGRPPDEKKCALKHRSNVRQVSDTRKKILESDLTTVPMNDQQRSVVEKTLKTLTLNTTYLTSEERDSVKQIFYACGVLSLNAAGEADNVLAYFAKRGEFDAIISNDLDLLARGVENLLVPNGIAYPGEIIGWVHYNLSNILTTVSFTHNQFLEMCVLMGSDYTVGLKSLQYRSAYWSIKYCGSLEASARSIGIKEIEPYNRACLILNGDCDSAEALMGEKQWEKWSAGAPPAEPETLLTFRKTYFPDLDDDKIALLCTCLT